jgi:TonB family protein
MARSRGLSRRSKLISMVALFFLLFRTVPQGQVVVGRATPAVGGNDCQAALAYEKGDYAEAACGFERASASSGANLELLKYASFSHASEAFETGKPQKKDGAWDTAIQHSALTALQGLLKYQEKGGKDPRVGLFLDQLFDAPILEAESREILLKKTKAHPEDARWWRWLTLLEESTGRYGEAVAAGQNWYRTSEHSAEAFIVLGKAILRQSAYSLPKTFPRIPDALENNIKAFQSYLSKAPNDPDGMDIFADLLDRKAMLMMDKDQAGPLKKQAEEWRARADEERNCKDRAVDEAASASSFPEYLPVSPPSYLLPRLPPPSAPPPEALQKEVVEAEPKPVGSIRPPRVIRQVKPVYPSWASSAGQQGRVIVEAIINHQGKVIDCRVLKSTNRIFNGPAMDSVRHWRFERPMAFPADPDSKPYPVSVYHIVTINFTMR